MRSILNGKPMQAIPYLVILMGNSSYEQAKVLVSDVFLLTELAVLLRSIAGSSFDLSLRIS